MPNPTPFRIPAQRVPLLEAGTADLMSREWYRFLNRTPRYGSFYDTTTQTAAAIDTPYAVTFNSETVSFAIQRGTPTSRIYVPDVSVYDVQFSLQLDKTSGGVGNIYIWPRIDGIDVPFSASRTRIQGNNAELVTAWNFMLDMQGGSYFELMWAVDTTSVQLIAEAATAFCPAIPSAILTVSEVAL
jgi:hypothetical protein